MPKTLAEACRDVGPHLSREYCLRPDETEDIVRRVWASLTAEYDVMRDHSVRTVETLFELGKRR